MSIIFCGSASGDILEPYVVYKSSHMWSTWTENSPKNARYNNSFSGWFDGAVYCDWFESIFVPKVKKLEERKVVICDNLSAHFTLQVLQLYKLHNISLVCLPPNSTRLTQPLDVAFFRPLKMSWRKILSDWKETDDGIKHGTIQKQYFPQLL